MRKTITLDPQKVGSAFQRIMDFMRDHTAVGMTLVGQRVKWTRGRSKKHNTRVGRVVKDTLTVKILQPKFPKSKYIIRNPR
jgi:hypothetical protein